MRGASARRIASSGLVLLLLLGCASQSAPPESALRADAEQALGSARTAYAGRQWSAAARGFGRAALTFGAIGASAAEAPARRDEAEALRRAGEPTLALEADQRALELDRHLGLLEGEASDLAGLARSAAAQGELDRAIETAEQAQTLAVPGTPLAAVLENDLALYLLVRGVKDDRPRVRELLASALASNQARSDAQGIATNELNLGRAALVFGDLDAAGPPLLQALESFRGLEDPDGLAHANEQLAKLYVATGETDRARFHLAQARAGFEFLHDVASLRRLDALERSGP